MPGNAAHEYEVREAINHVVSASRRLLDTDERPVHRGQHPKQHGCVRARFVVGTDLGTASLQGLFQQQRVYDAWIRFSNGAQRDDRKPDAHGMAVKLMGVDGPKVLATEKDATTQDFLMVDNPTFFLRDAVEYSGFSDVLLKARGKERSSVYNMLGFVLTGPVRSLATVFLLSVFEWRIPTFLRLIKFAGKRIANPLTTRYWSTTPFKFGDTCMKFSAVPVEFPTGLPADGPRDDSYDALTEFLRPAVAAPAVTTRPKGDSPDYLREALSGRLGSRGAVFLFQVQLFKDDKTTPLNDPTVEWPEDAAPFQTVARIWIPKQVFDTPGRMAFGENLSFTPWHAIPAHEPLGEINQVRKDVYSKLSDLRHRLNGVEPREPNPSDPDPVDLAPQWGTDSSAFERVLQDELELIRERRRHVEAASSDGGDGRHRPASAVGDEKRAERVVDGRSETPDGGLAPSRDVDRLTTEAQRRALNEHTTGLALAGEGAPGATFAVGFLQGLATRGLIRRFDYLSAVSGGGYAAAWLAAWLKREGGDPENVERQLNPSRIPEARATRHYLATREVVDQEPEPLRHLRSATGSLLPRTGIFSTDAWTRILSWMRNVTINMLALLTLLVHVVAGARLVVALYGLLNRLTELDQKAAVFDSRLNTPVFVTGVVALALMFLAGAVALGFAFASIASSLRQIRRADSRLHVEPSPSDPDALVNRRIVTPVLAAALLFSLSLPPIWRGFGELVGTLRFGPDTGGLFSVRTIFDVALAQFTLLSWPNFLAHAVIVGGLLAWWTSRSSAGEEALRRKKLVGASFAAGVTGGLLLVGLEGLCSWFAQLGRLDLVATLVPALALLFVVASMVVEVMVLGRAASDAERAWWAGVSGLLAKRAIWWIAAMATILYLPGVIYGASGMALTAGAVGWIGAAAFGVLAGRYVLPRSGGAHTRWLTWLASIAAQVFLVGLLGATAFLVALIANMPSLTAPAGDDVGPFAYYLRGMDGTSILTLLGIALGFGVLHALTRRLIDVNLFSLCALEADRLTRCYIGASRPISAWRMRWSQPRDPRVTAGAPSLSDPTCEPVLPPRSPDPLSGLDPFDDLELRALCIGRKSDNDRVYWGPHLLFNTTLSAAGHRAIGRRDGNGESFLLSPLYCGSQSLGYARTETSKPVGGADPNLSLGRVVAISGAVGDPRTGSLPPKPLTALLTLFSARPGSWMEKPKPDGWTAASPRFGDLPVAAFLGLAGGGGNFVHLAAGEEFDGLGVYELIRRRCRYIVAVDAGRDGGVPDANLANLIQRCRIDFGVRIEIDTRPLQKAGSDGLCSAHFAIGQVHYGDVDPGGMPGLLLYAKMSMTGDEPLDIQQYARSEARFPHQPDDLQREFDDRQFECYRCLGNHIADAVFEDAALRVGKQFPDPARKPHAEYVARLFAAINEWGNDTPKGEATRLRASARVLSEPEGDGCEIAPIAERSRDLQPEQPQPAAVSRGRGRGAAPPRADAGTGRR